MPKVLVALSEVIDALEGLEIVNVDGGKWVDAQAFGDAMMKLAVGWHGSRAMAWGPNETLPKADPFVTPRPDARMYGLGNDDPNEAERARLAALPPGPCACYTRYQPYPNDPRYQPELHVHPGGPCPACSMLEGAGCDDYVDTTVRDPIQARIEANPWGTAPDAGPIPPAPDAGDPQVNPAARPASNVNAFRPPSG